MFTLDQVIHLEIIGEVNAYVGMGIQSICAVIFGGIIGLDREKKLKPAGVKTQILICVGAALYTMIGMTNIPDSITTYDPNRIAAQIVSGIGFLGAGAIIQSQGRITGMTTAASIWIVAAIGIAIGSGQIFTAAFFTAVIWGTLNLISPVLKFIRPQKRYMIQILGPGGIESDIISYLKEIEDDAFDLKVFVENSECDIEKGCKEQINLKITFSRSELKRFVSFARSIPEVDSVTSRVI